MTGEAEGNCYIPYRKQDSKRADTLSTNGKERAGLTTAIGSVRFKSSLLAAWRLDQSLKEVRREITWED